MQIHTIAARNRPAYSAGIVRAGRVGQQKQPVVGSRSTFAEGSWKGAVACRRLLPGAKMTQIELHVEDTRGSRRPLPIVHEDSFDEYSRDEINNEHAEAGDKIARGGMLRVHIDPFNYDVAPEADEEMRFHWGPWIEDCSTQTFWPVSPRTCTPGMATKGCRSSARPADAAEGRRPRSQASRPGSAAHGAVARLLLPRDRRLRHEMRAVVLLLRGRLPRDARRRRALVGARVRVRTRDVRELHDDDGDGEQRSAAQAQRASAAHLVPGVATRSCSSAGCRSRGGSPSSSCASPRSKSASI